MPLSRGRVEDVFIGFVLILLIFGVVIGWVLPVDQNDVTLSFAQAIQGNNGTSACTQFDSTTAMNESGLLFQLTAKSFTIIFQLTVVLVDNLTNAGIQTSIFYNSTNLASNIACGMAPTGANQISLAPYVSPSVANAQFTTTYNFPFINAASGTLYTFFLGVSSSVAHAKIVVVAKLGQAVKTNMIGQAI